MSFWNNPFATSNATPLQAAVSAEREARNVPVSTESASPSLLATLGLAGHGFTGVSVNQGTVMAISAVWACVNNLSQDIAGLPLQVFQAVDSGKIKLSDHPAIPLLNLQASPLQNSFHFRQTMAAVALLRGNAYALIEYNARMEPVRLTFKENHATEVIPSGGRLYYRFNGGKMYQDYEVLHFRGLSLDGVLGLSPLHAHRETFGKALAASKAQTSFYNNGAKTSSALETDKTLSPGAVERLASSFQAKYGGLDNAGKPIILEEGLKYKSISMPPADAEYIATANLTMGDVCRIFRMPPHKIADLTRSTNNNIEQQSLDYVGDTLMPWALNFEQEYRLKLCRARELATTTFRHNIGGLLRADHAARATYYGKMTDIGVYSINEVRALEEQNGIGPMGDARFVQVNRQTLELATAPKPAPEPATPTTNED